MAKEHEDKKVTPEAKPAFRTTVEDAPEVKEDEPPISDRTKMEMAAGKQAGAEQEEKMKQHEVALAKAEAEAKVAEKKADKE